jgi:lambda family phage minor tail protein L
VSTIRHDVQKLSPGAELELFELDATALGGDLEYFFNGTDSNRAPIVWKGVTYTPWVVWADGFDVNGRGQFPTPHLRLANIGNSMTVRCLAYHDLVGAKITRRRTFAQYLDGQPGADPTQGHPDDVFFIERKVIENRVIVEWELGSVLDVEGVMVPGRQVLVVSCPSVYRESECSYAGPAVAKADDTPTSDLALDRCSHKLSGCKLRFGQFGPLRFGGFPGAARR